MLVSGRVPGKKLLISINLKPLNPAVCLKEWWYFPMFSRYLGEFYAISFSNNLICIRLKGWDRETSTLSVLDWGSTVSFLEPTGSNRKTAPGRRFCDEDRWRQQIGEKGFLALYSFTHRIHVWHIYLHLVDFDGKCRQIYHKWFI